MQIRLACIEDGLENVGFKKLAAYVKSIHQNTKAAYVPTGNVYSLLKHITENVFGFDVHPLAAIQSHFRCTAPYRISV